MFASVIAFILSIFVLFGAEKAALNIAPLPYLFAFASFFLLSSFVLIHTFSWGALQKMQYSFTPRAVSLHKADKLIRFFSLVIALFSLLTLYVVIDPQPFAYINARTGFAIWILFFGICLDLLHQLMERQTRYLDPFYLLSLFTAEAKASVANDRESSLTKHIDSISEIGLKATQQRLPSLANSSLSDLSEVVAEFLKAAKSFAHNPTKPEEAGSSDPVSFILFYTFQRIDNLFQCALSDKMETIISQTLHVLGKMAIAAANYDLTVVAYPLHFIGKFAKSAVKQGMEEVGAKATLLLYEVGKTILNEVDTQYQSLKEPLFSLTKQMEEITEEMFKQNRDIEIALLAKPFTDLFNLFEEEKHKNHPDTGLIQGDIARVLRQYSELNQAMHRLQPASPIQSEDSIQKE